MQHLLMTGVTGTLGKELVKAILSSTDSRLFLLVRSKKQYSCWDRIRKIFAGSKLEVGWETRIQGIEGDVTEPEFGLSARDIEMLEDQVTHFYHVAALTALNGSREDCHRVNIVGTQEALKLARRFWARGRLQRFYYFSTAYAVGSLQDYQSYEDVLPENPRHANFYEWSKYQAEGLVREAMAEGLPVTIFRPSIVVGHSQTGEVSEFNVIYPFMKLFAHGILTKLPTRPTNSFNLVPIDFITQATLTIAPREDSVGKTYHLVTLEPPTIGTLLQLKEREYPELPKIEIVDPHQFHRGHLSATEQLVYEMLAPYLGYLNYNLTFHTANTEQALAGTGVAFPKTDYDFLKRLIEYAVRVGYLVPSL